MARDCGTFKKVEEKSLINRKNARERGVQKEKYKQKDSCLSQCLHQPGEQAKRV